MRNYFLIVTLLVVSNSLLAQIDSSYIKPFDFRLSVRPYISKDFLFLTQEFNSDKDITFMPNNPVNIGLGLFLNNTILSFGYGYGFDFMRDKEQGKTESFDFQLHNYGQKIVFDLFLQRYKGFYEDRSDKEIILYPDMEIHQYGIYGQYVFNNKKFSYKAAFNQNEKQLKSVGTFLLGGGVYKTRIKSDTSFHYQDKNVINNIQFGINAGYAYIWVLGKRWDISTSITLGINFGSDKLNTFGRKLYVSPSVFPRISAGYNHNTWSLGFSYVGNIIFPAMVENESISIHSGSFQFSFSKRLDLIPLLDKR